MKYWFVVLIILLVSCTRQKKSLMEEQHPFTNDLIHETSPYLLQHAHNPVDWKPWNQKVLDQAKQNDQLIIISVGYAACHWCHVMEHESFEDPEVAKIMNGQYISIKVDREERPDIDQVYMNAVQLMTGSGGWPLNVVALPDGRPVWGGTYFPKENWIDALQQISDLYKKQPEKLIEYAEKLEEGIKAVDVITANPDPMKFDKEFLEAAVKKWSEQFDHTNGGTKRVPKFMMPNNYHFLLRYAHQTENSELLSFVYKTLTQISFGGIYDHIGGGFSRYATDAKWHIPHFEKMLYDNAQLVSVYCDAYLVTKDEWFKTVVFETLAFVSRELTSKEGAFYSSLDADSLAKNGELEEGAFYIWSKTELETLLGDDFMLFSKYYNINDYGLWENQQYVLIRRDQDANFSLQYALGDEIVSEKVKAWKKKLFDYREQRPKPRLDDKTLTSWNALMLKAYLDAYRVFGDQKFLDIAYKNAHFIEKNQLQRDATLLHSYKNGKSTVNGYLEDYATVIEAFLLLYQNTLDTKWLDNSERLAAYTIRHFFDTEKNIFYFTSNQDPKLIARTIESSDNVISSSNSIMAKNLFLLSHYYDKPEYKEISQNMLHTIKPQIQSYPSGYANWLDVMLNYTFTYYETVVVGEDALQKIQELQKKYIPNQLLAGSTEDSKMPLLHNRFTNEKTLIYICVNNACKYPVDNIEEAIKLLK
ncbi:thioredoxin domain-containing protein [Aquimarina sp. U1-2]|uniref:thioredoxin domain-containing protein n=1 Tax=Aquimarina sp. U1-2 TaxID=2823141 RepID=UPI001AECC9C0|nr:thioredoxin domain-containing protein [Aquimarina sp. U1-2]MBP2832489.1 thioredoxin domain-containing protein [Aquimarina sp. U1-2]